MTANEIPFDKLIEAASSQGTGKNADSILGMLKEVNTVLGELQKTVDFFRRIGVLPGIVRAMGKKYNVDVDTPLANEMSVVAPTANHKVIMENLSKLDEPHLIEFVQALNEYGTKKALSSGNAGDRQQHPENN